MKKLSSILVIFTILSGLLFIWSCHKNKEGTPNLPTVTINGKVIDSITVDKSYIINLKIDALANQNSLTDLTNLKMHVKFIPGDSFDKNFPLLAGEVKSATRRDTLISDNAPDGQLIQITVIVTDKDGQKNTAHLVATVYHTVRVYIGDTVGDQSNLNIGSSYSSSDNKIYTLQQAKPLSSKIDFCYFFDVNNAGTFAAPVDSYSHVNLTGTYGPASWTTQNATTFRQIKYMDDSSFVSLTKDNIQSLYINAGTTISTHTKALVDPHSGQQSFYAFKTLSTLKYGVVRADILDQTNHLIVFSVVIQR